ncbi:MAG: MMPL family transporter [Isosphaeraceae bacterium]|nr:MMPL family transporter [Isosphaeraceae bacterium]
MFDAIARLVNSRGWLVVVSWALLAAALHTIAPRWETVSRDDDVSFFPKGFASVTGAELLKKGFPRDVASSQVVIIAERTEGRLEQRDLAYVDRIFAAVDGLRQAEKQHEIKGMLDRRTPFIGTKLIGRDSDERGEATIIVISLNGTYQSKKSRIAVDRLLEVMEAVPDRPEGLKVGLTGSAAVGHDMNLAANESVANTTTATIALVVIILLVVYRSPLLALLPLLSIALSVWISIKAIAALTLVPGLDFQVINITNIFVIVVLFGAGTDYCLFLIARYREELARGRRGPQALREAIVQVGGALVASAGTVICGLGMLWFSSFAKIQYTGPAIALSLAIGLAASLTLAPVLLHWLRGAVFFPFKPPHHEKGHDRETEMLEQIPLSGFWSRVAEVVIRRPGVILAASLAAMTPFAVIGSQTRSNYSQLTDLSADQTSVVGARMVQRFFSAGELGPTGLIVEHRGLDFRSDAGRASVGELSKRLLAVPGIAEVRSVSQPLGKPPVSFQEQLAARVARPIADARYVSTAPGDPADRDRLTRLELVFQDDPFSEASLERLGTIKQVVREATSPGGPLAGAEAFGFTGSTAMVADLREVTTADARRMYVLVTVGVYLILVALIRRPGICLYLIATVVLGYLASLGITELVFKAMHPGPDPWVGLDWKVGFFLFVILVAVGEDYNIFLMARVIEEEKKHGTIEGTRLAIAHTGGIISSCGLIMAGTFGSMLTGSLTTLRELGFALGLGVLLDTFVVRPVLVPAFVVLLDRRRSKPRSVPAASAASESSVESSPAGT